MAVCDHCPLCVTSLNEVPPAGRVPVFINPPVHIPRRQIANSNVISVSCGHVFHKVCLFAFINDKTRAARVPWPRKLRHTALCPCCRMKFYIRKLYPVCMDPKANNNNGAAAGVAPPNLNGAQVLNNNNGSGGGGVPPNPNGAQVLNNNNGSGGGGVPPNPSGVVAPNNGSGVPPNPNGAPNNNNGNGGSGAPPNPNGVQLQNNNAAAPVDINEGKGTDGECPICLNCLNAPYNLPNNMVVPRCARRLGGMNICCTSCGHLFHTSCLLRHLLNPHNRTNKRNTGLCPTCRIKIYIRELHPTQFLRRPLPPPARPPQPARPVAAAAPTPANAQGNQPPSWLARNFGLKWG